MKMFRFNFYYTRKENFFNNNNAEQLKRITRIITSSIILPLSIRTITPRIINVVVFRVPLQELWYNCLDAVDWYITPTTRWFSEGSNHSLFAVC